MEENSPLRFNHLYKIMCDKKGYHLSLLSLMWWVVDAIKFDKGKWCLECASVFGVGN